jgi:cytochrome c-type biogenesis protein CcmH
MPCLFLVLLILITGDPTEQQARISRLENSLLAPCCYQETLARHMSETAVAMRAELRAMVAQGKSDRQILDHYKRRYGKRVLVEPEGTAWWIMGVVPVLVVILGVWFVIHILRRWRAP